MGKPQEKKIGSGASKNVPQGPRDVFGDLLETVSSKISKAAGDTGKEGAGFLEVVTAAIQDSLRGAVSLRSDLVMGSKAIIVGVLRGTGAAEEAALKTLSWTASIVLRQAAELRTDLAACTKGLVLGAIAGAKDHGVDRAKAASAAAQGALEGVHDTGSEAVGKVHDALREAIGGVTVELPPPPKT